MALKDEFRKMVEALSEKFAIPAIENIFFPPFTPGGQPKESAFMGMSLQGGAAGVSYVLLPDANGEEYSALQPADFIGKNPRQFALAFGHENPVKEMLSLAAINAVCQHVRREVDFPVDHATDSLGLLSVSAGDRVGMVGLFTGITRAIEKAGAQLVVVEKNERLRKKFPDLTITPDPAALTSCNKILCTSTTVLNHSLEEILAHCSPDAFVSIIGPTAGYFPDPLFARGVDVVGGRVVEDGGQFLQLLADRKRWGGAARKTCFQKKTYRSILGS